MIIKSMSRKSRSFSQLFSYMEKGSSKNSDYDFFSKNLYGNSAKDISDEFLENARLLRSRANGNYLFHEIISLTKSKQLALEEEKKRLFDIVRVYAQKRCNNNLVVGFLHDEKSNNIHFHLMISSNEVGEYRNQRLTKFEFDKIKKSTEKYVLKTYPELGQDIIINAQKSHQKTRLSNKAGEVKRKGNRLVKKEKIIAKLKKIFLKSRTKNELFHQLSHHNINMYNRGKTIGFINNYDKKKYRLKTLALENEFNKMNTFMNESNEKTLDTETSERSQKKHFQEKQPRSENAQMNKSKNEINSRKEQIKNARNSFSKSRGDKEKSKDFE